MNQPAFDLIFILIMIISGLSLLDDAIELYKVIVVLNLVIMVMYFMLVRGPRYINKINDGNLASMLSRLLLFIPTMAILFIMAGNEEFDVDRAKVQMGIYMMIGLSCLTIIRFLYRKYWLKRKEKTDTKT